MKTTVAVSVAALLLGAATASQGAETLGSSLDRLVGCADIADSSARLACFDRGVAPLRPQRAAAPNIDAPVAMPAPLQAPPSVAIAPQPAPAQSPPVTSPAPAAVAQGALPNQFGIGEEQLKGRNQVQVAEENRSLNARITGVRSGGGGTYLISLDNGMVWRHEQGSMANYLNPGEAVTITRASMGSYRLTLDSAGNGKSWVRVTRVR